MSESLLLGRWSMVIRCRLVFCVVTLRDSLVHDHWRSKIFMFYAKTICIIIFLEEALISGPIFTTGIGVFTLRQGDVCFSICVKSKPIEHVCRRCHLTVYLFGLFSKVIWLWEPHLVFKVICGERDCALSCFRWLTFCFSTNLSPKQNERTHTNANHSYDKYDTHNHKPIPKRSWCHPGT